MPFFLLNCGQSFLFIFSYLPAYDKAYIKKGGVNVKKYVYILDKNNLSKVIMSNPSIWTLSRLFFNSNNLTFDSYVLDTTGIELYMREDDHAVNNELGKNFYYKNTPKQEAMNFVCGRLLLVSENKAKIDELINLSNEYKLKIKEAL